MVHVDDVHYFGSDTKYTRVVSDDIEGLVRPSLKELLLQLDERQYLQRLCRAKDDQERPDEEQRRPPNRRRSVLFFGGVRTPCHCGTFLPCQSIATQPSRQPQPTVQSLTQPWQPPYRITTPYFYSRRCTPGSMLRCVRSNRPCVYDLDSRYAFLEASLVRPVPKPNVKPSMPVRHRVRDWRSEQKTCSLLHLLPP
ncbi:hypothetical protein OKW35_000400 [Paraburkholderia sp. MM5477-R1]